MKTNQNGNRYRNYDDWNHVVDAPYDYKRKGLLKHLMSKIIIDAATDDNGMWKRMY